MFNKTGVLIIFLIAAIVMAQVHAFAQANIGFENGTFDNWDFGIGTIVKNGSMRVEPAIAVPGSFTILKNDQSDTRDPYGDFSVFSPNGSKYTAKLGNIDYGNTVQQLSYTLTVPPSGSNSIIFDYAVVLENPGHEPHEQPRFTVKIYNVTDRKYMDCPTFDFFSSADMPGFKINRDGVSYKDWSSATINLTGLNNKQIRLEFTVNHCPYGEHFGYAYLDVHENISTPIEGNNYCINQTAINLSVPPGFASYAWFTADFKTSLGTGQYLTLTPPPADLTRLAVVIAPYNGLGCTDTLYTTVNGLNSNVKFVAKEAIAGCPGSAVDLTDGQLTIGSSPGLTFTYLTNSLDVLSSPFRITQPGVYYIRATSPGGCSDLLPVNVSFALPPLQIADPATVTYPATVDLSQSFAAQPNVSYSYFRDVQTTQPLVNFTAVATSGTYYIKAEGNLGCANIQPINVTILPPESFSVTTPNTFTPNNDGINDQFLIAFNGYISFGRLQIYNRNGALMFDTTKAGQFWDGNYNGRPVSTGTYYWVFEGYDNYYHKKVSRSSFITLIR